MVMEGDTLPHGRSLKPQSQARFLPTPPPRACCHRHWPVMPQELTSALHRFSCTPTPRITERGDPVSMVIGAVTMGKLREGR